MAKIINYRDTGEVLILVIANMIAFVVLLALLEVLRDRLDYGVSMFMGWISLIAMQGWFFWWAMDGTKWRKTIEASRRNTGKAEE